MAMYLTPLNELEAVNMMLAAIGETPASSLENVTSVYVEQAQNLLRITSRQIQELGLHCNTDRAYRISPNTDGEIVLPLNTLDCDEIIPQGNYFRDLTVRGSKLYDTINHTFDIGEAVYVDIVRFLDFEELPANTRDYITVRAARVFHDQTLGDQVEHQFTKQDEVEAKRRFTRSQLRNSDRNFLRNRSSQRILNRRAADTLRSEYLT